MQNLHDGGRGCIVIFVVTVGEAQQPASRPPLDGPRLASSLYCLRRSLAPIRCWLLAGSWSGLAAGQAC